MRRVPTGDDFDEWSYPLHMMGYASTLPAEEDAHDPVVDLHNVVEEITGRAVAKPEPRRIGFI